MQSYRYTMNVAAVAEGFGLETGDCLTAYANGVKCGSVEVGDAYTEKSEPLYLTIGGDKKTGITLAIERDGEIVALATELMTFCANTIVGTPDNPFVVILSDATGIDFVPGNYEPGKWYTTNGIRIATKPTRPGVYIYNNSKVVIKK